MIAPKLIVTGLSGLLGTRLRALAAGRFELVNVDITEGIDITDAAQIRGVFTSHRDSQAAIHLAAFTDVSAAHAQSGDEEGSCHRINVVGTRNVVEACRAAELHLIFVSTDFVFDGEKTEPYTETDAPTPIEWYGRTKFMAEEAVRELPASTTLRIAYPYVAGEAARADLVRRFRDALAEGKELTLFDDQIITPTFADDIIEGLLLLASERPAGEFFHLVGSSWVSPFALGLRVAEVFGLDASLIKPSSLADLLKTDSRPRQQALRLSNEKWTAFARRHGLDAPATIERGLARVREAAGL